MQAPKPLTPNESQTFDFSNPTFDWDPTPGASSYTVEVCRDPECGQLVDRAVGVKMSRWTPRVPPHRGAVLARERCERERSRQLHLPRHEVHHPDLLAPARGSALGSTTMALPLASLGSLVFLVALGRIGRGARPGSRRAGPRPLPPPSRWRAWASWKAASRFQHPGGAWTKAAEDQPLLIGDRVRTLKGGTARLEFPWTAVAVGDGSEVSIPNARVLTLQLDRGRLDIDPEQTLLRVVTGRGRDQRRRPHPGAKRGNVDLRRFVQRRRRRRSEGRDRAPRHQQGHAGDRGQSPRRSHDPGPRAARGLAQGRSADT